MTANGLASPATDKRGLDVFFTVDVEVWCDGWTDIDAKFPQAFRRYVYGPTAAGDFGLPYQLELLRAHGLKGVFFIEPLFAARFGTDALAEVVGLVRDAGHETQLHLHTEWVDEARVPLLTGGATNKRPFLHQFSRSEQTVLIGHGKELLRTCGAADPTAFRAGSFGINRASLAAVRANGLSIDSSYNASMLGPHNDEFPGGPLLDSVTVDGILEFPMTVFDVAGHKLRHVQLGACSYSEIEGLLWRALEIGRRSFVILSHNFELLNDAKDRRDGVVVNRFRKLCAFLERNRDTFHTRGFDGGHRCVEASAPRSLSSPVWKAAARTAEQLYRRMGR